MADESHSRPPGFLRATGKEWARLISIRPVAPPALLWRVGRWWWGTVVRESAPQIALFAALVLGVLLLLGAAGSTAGVVAIVLLALVLVWELRHAYLAHKSVARIEEALEGIERGEEGPRVPRSHLVIPPLAFVTRGVRRTRGVKFAELEDGTNLRLDVYRPADDDPTTTSCTRP